MGMLDWISKGAGMLSNAAPGLAYLSARRQGVDMATALAQMQQMQQQAAYGEAMRQRQQQMEEDRQAAKDEATKVENMRQSQLAVSGMLSGMDPQQRAQWVSDPANLAWLSQRSADPGISQAMVNTSMPPAQTEKELDTFTDESGNRVVVMLDERTGQTTNRVVGRTQSPTAPERKTAEDQAGVLRYVDTGEPVFPGSSGMPPKESFTREQTLRGEFSKAVAPYVTQMQAAGRVIPILETGGGGVNDLALIMQFMKVLDPGSTVREGEIANVQNASGVPAQIQTWYNSILRGDSLSPVQRQEVANLISGVYGSAYDLYAGTAKQYTDLSHRYLIKPENVVLEPNLPYTPERLQTSKPLPKVGEIVSGSRFKGGDPSKPESWEKAL